MKLCDIEFNGISSGEITLPLNWGDFLDWFYYPYRNNKSRLEAIQTEPIWACNKETSTFVAASVHFLARKYQLEIPSWVFKEQYILEEPYFSLKAKGDLRIVLLAESPIEFKMRNMFVSSNSLDRV